jgi:hypothetical protein
MMWFHHYGIPTDMAEIAGPIVALISGFFIGLTLVSYLFAKKFDFISANPIKEPSSFT